MFHNVRRWTLPLSLRGTYSDVGVMIRAIVTVVILSIFWMHVHACSVVSKSLQCHRL